MTLKTLLGSVAIVALTGFAITANAAGVAAADKSSTPAATQSSSDMNNQPSSDQKTMNQGTQTQSTTGASASSASSASLSLTEVQNPQDTLAKASVQDNQGNAIGPVHDVTLGSNGKPTAVNVDVGTFLGTGSKVVAIKANKLKFQQDRNILVTTMTKDQIKALPQAKGT
jgi:hypothetical protein